MSNSINIFPCDLHDNYKSSKPSRVSKFGTEYIVFHIDNIDRVQDIKWQSSNSIQGLLHHHF